MFPACKKRSKPQEQAGPFRQGVDQHVLVVGMGAAAARAQAVEGRDAQRRGEVAVAAAAGRSLRELQAKLAGQSRRACSKSAAIAGVRSMGGRLNDPVMRESYASD